MKKKYIDGSDIDPQWLLDHTTTYQFIDDHQAHLTLINIHKVATKISVDYDDSDTCLVDDGYKCMMYLPVGKTWCLSVFIDNNNKIIEWYFDMTKMNALDNKDKPYFLDLYLDIAVSAKGFLVILDEDELDEAYEKGIIDGSDCQLAHETCQYLIKEVIPNSAFMNQFFYRHLERLTQMKNNKERST